MSTSSQSYFHSIWALGHALVLVGTGYTLTSVFGLPGTNKAYYLAYAGAIISWGIVVYKSLGTPQLSRAYVQRALLDENVQYLLLALYWFLQKPIYVALIPFATFSLFHTLTFLRTTVLPKAPASPAATPGTARTPAAAAASSTTSAMVSKQIQTWVKAHYEQAMLFVAFVEVVVVFGRVLFGALLFQNSFLAPLFFAHFLRLRYYLSPPTRQAFAWVSGQIDNLINSSSCPASVKKGVTLGREMIIRYSESVLQVNNAPPAAGAAAAGAGPAPAAAAR